MCGLISYTTTVQKGFLLKISSVNVNKSEFIKRFFQDKKINLQTKTLFFVECTNIGYFHYEIKNLQKKSFGEKPNITYLRIHTIEKFSAATRLTRSQKNKNINNITKCFYLLLGLAYLFQTNKEHLVEYGNSCFRFNSSFSIFICFLCLFQIN